MLPDIVSAAYVYGPYQSAVQVTYSDATTAIVYPNQFEDPRAQQLNRWVAQGNEISAYVPEPTPKPGPPQFISLVPSAQVQVGTGEKIDNWTKESGYGLVTDGTYVTLTPFRTYQISFTIAAWYFTTPNEYMVFGIVDGNDDPILDGNSQVVIAPSDWAPTTGQNSPSTQTFLFTPLESIDIALACVSTGGTSADVRPEFTTWTVTELVDATL